MDAKQLFILNQIFLVISSILPNVKGRQVDMKDCKFDGQVPSFHTHGYWLQCIEKNCKCDGSNTGYKDCQSCCCGIRQKYQACPNETKTVIPGLKNDTENDNAKSFQVGFFVTLVILIAYFIASVAYIVHQRKKIRNIEDDKRTGIQQKESLINEKVETKKRQVFSYDDITQL